LKKSKIIKLEIDDTLYRYVTMHGLWEYKVIGIKIVEGVTQYITECQACTHGYRCEVMVVQRPNHNAFQFVSILNDEYDDYGDSDYDEQYYWHNDSWYYTTKNEAKNKIYTDLINNKKVKVKEAKETLKRLEKELFELEQIKKPLINKDGKK